MGIGILFTMLVSWFIGAIGIGQFFIHRKYAKHIILKLYWPSRLFSIFWMLAGSVWMLVGLGDLLDWKGYIAYTHVVVYIFETLLAVAMVIAWKYLLSRFFPDRSHWIPLLPFIAVALAFIWALFYYGVEIQEPTFFAQPAVINTTAQILFAIMFISTVGVAMADGIRALASRTVVSSERIFVLLASLSFFLLGIDGALEQFGFTHSVIIPFSRILSLIAVIIAYIATMHITSLRQNTKQIVI